MQPLNTTTEILSLEEARARLPKVKPLVERMMQLTAEAGDVQKRMRGVSGSDRVEMEARFLELRSQLESVVREINELGATVKDASQGLIDFYAWNGDDMVLLCWLHGEDTIRYWHGLHEGFAGRKSLDDHPIG